MVNQELKKQLQRIEWLLRHTPEATAGELELQAHWGRYLCVLAAGFLENAIGLVYSDYAYRVAPPTVASYASSQLFRIQNPNANRFIATARDFRSDWAEELEQFLENEGRKEAIDGIMAQRHQIAHGRDVGITVARVASYLRRSVEVIEFIEEQCAR
jgi:hypothetical protein